MARFYSVQSAADAALDVVERIFFYMPLQHAESREVQEESVAAYRHCVSAVFQCRSLSPARAALDPSFPDQMAISTAPG